MGSGERYLEKSVYPHTGGHAPGDACTEVLWAMRVRIHDDASGVDLLPAPGSPADRGRGMMEIAS